MFLAMAEPWRPRFSNLDLLDAVGKPRRIRVDEPFTPVTDLDAGALKTISQVYEGLKAPIARALGVDPANQPATYDLFRKTQLRGLTNEPTNLSGTHLKQTGDVYVGPQVWNNYSDNTPMLETLAHEMVHTVPEAYHGGTFDKDYSKVMADPEVAKALKHYAESMPPGFLMDWERNRYFKKRKK